MSWLFSRALVEEYSPDKCSDGAQSVQSNGKPTPQAYLQRDKTTATWNRFPSGMTCEPLTADRGEAVLMSFLAAFPAKTLAQPEKAQELTVSDPACGWKWPASSVKYDLDSRSWKTRQCSLLGGLVEFSETWPRWGSMRNGECWEQPMWGRRMDGSESGLLPDGKTFFHTPNTNGLDGGSNSRKALKARINQERWPTPAARDFRSPNSKPYSERGGGKKGEQLPNAVGGQLNPPWVEWLMGWPIGWTALEPLETAKSPNAQQPRLSKAVGG